MCSIRLFKIIMSAFSTVSKYQLFKAFSMIFWKITNMIKYTSIILALKIIVEYTYDIKVDEKWKPQDSSFAKGIVFADYSSASKEITAHRDSSGKSSASDLPTQHLL